MPEMPAEAAPVDGAAAPPPVDANGAPPAVVEPAKAEPPKTPETPQETALLRSIRRRESDLLRRQQQWQADQRAATQSIDQRVQAEVAKALGRLKEDPLAVLKEHGWDDEKLAGRLISGGKKPTDEVARTTAEELAAFRKELADKNAADARAKTERDYLELIGKGGWDKYPTTHEEWDDAGRIRETYAMLTEAGARYKARGETPPHFTDTEIAEALEVRAKSVQAAREARKKGRPAPAVKDAPQGDPKVASPGNGSQGKPAGETATTTLNGRLSSDRASGNAPDVLTMTAEEQRAYYESEMAKARAAVTGKA